jgi:Ni/Fe-hydrogenase 1 B-type cytochrome subunit
MAHLAHYKEAHPTIFVVTHWINLVAMIFLILSGIMIHFPLFPTNMGVCARPARLLRLRPAHQRASSASSSPSSSMSAPTGGTRQADRRITTDLACPRRTTSHQAGAWIKFYLFSKKDRAPVRQARPDAAEDRLPAHSRS